MNCDHIDLSSTLSEKRIQQVKAIFGDKIINKILAWALFLLGASKPSICEAVDMKPDSLRSFLHLIQHKGLSTLESGSGKASSFKPVITLKEVKSLKNWIFRRHMSVIYRRNWAMKILLD
jgi:hypothetical protein